MGFVNMIYDIVIVIFNGQIVYIENETYER